MTGKQNTVENNTKKSDVDIETKAGNSSKTGSLTSNTVNKEEAITFEMSTSLLASIEKLNGRENYSTWKYSIENYLALEELSKCLDGTETDMKKNAKAKAAIALSVDKSVFVHVKSADTVKNMWENLQSTFEDKGVVRKITLMRKIVNTKLESCESMETYVSEIMSTAQKLTDLGFTVSDEWLAVFLLCGLTEEYQPMVMALEGLGKTLSSDSIKTKLLQETSTVTDEKALFAKKGSKFRRKGDVSCYTCKQRGHKSFQCPTKSSDSGAKTDSKEKNKALFAFSAVFLSVKYNEHEWHLDSGATRHMTMHEGWIEGTKRYGYGDIRAANNDMMKVICSGDVSCRVNVHGKSSGVTMKDVMCVPGLTTNLLSVSQMTSKGYSVIFLPDMAEIRDKHGSLIATATEVDGLYRLDVDRGTAFTATGKNDSMELWHRRCAHLNLADLRRMRNGGVNGMSFVDSEKSEACVACCKGKQSRNSFPREGSRANQLIEIIHADIAGKMECRSIGGSKFCLVLVDDYSRRTFVYMLKHKSEVFDRFCSFKSLVENQTGLRIKTFRSDNGTEFCTNKFKEFFERHGIQHQTSIPYTPQQNGLAERTIRTITEKARCMLQDAGLNKRYWAEALHTAAYIKNRMTSTILENKSPIEIWTGMKPDISHFRVFGSKAMAFIPKEKRQKFDAKSKEYIFVGYCETQKGYRLMDAKTNEVIACRDVEVIESGNDFLNNDANKKEFEFIILDFIDSSENASSESSVDSRVDESMNDHGVQHGLNNVAIDPSTAEIEGGVQHGPNNVDQREAVRSSEQMGNTSMETTRDESDFDDTRDDLTFVPEERIGEDSTEDQQVRRSDREPRPIERYQAGLLTRQENIDDNINEFFETTKTSTHYANEPNCDEPKTVKQAIGGSEKLQWKIAMDDEYNSLMTNQTWEITKLPTGCKAINCKWVFKYKQDSDGNLKYKARLVAKGYSQREGIDYVETFSPVVRYSSLRLLMAMTVKFGWKIEQMDVVTAFLHGDISETIYMRQPEAYDDGSGNVCRLKKALYGLKQASRQWNIKLNDVLEKAGFKRCKKDSCVYVRRVGESIVVIAVYVDDLLIFYNNNEWKDQLKSTLKNNFKMKELGNATSVLGIQIEYDRKAGTLSLNQRKYIESVLRKFNMFECDPVRIPCDPNTKLTKDMAPTNVEKVEEMKKIPYQEVVGSVSYLAQCTRPDILFSVTYVSQFNQNHGLAHWTAVKRILRYLKGTLNAKLTYTKQQKFVDLQGHTDADWASSFCNSKSCTGYAFMWQNAAISWACKKQPTVALSTTEAELMSLSAATQEALWINHLKDEILSDKQPTIELFCDNKGAVDLTGTYSARVKHMDMRHYFIRDCIQNKQIKVTKIKTDFMIADNLTKAVPIQKHNFCSSNMLNFSF